MTEEEKFIDDLKELIMVPSIYKYLLYKASELKYLLAYDINNYQELRAMLNNEKKPHITSGEKFIIFRYGNQWQSPVGTPRQILDYIGKLELNVGTPVMIRDLEFPGLGENVYDLLLERLDENNISLIIHVSAHPPADKKETHLSQSPSDHALKELIGYLASDKTFREYVLAQFRYQWKFGLGSQVTQAG